MRRKGRKSHTDPQAPDEPTVTGRRPSGSEGVNRQFHRNDAFELWVLHVWLYKDNPAGMFSDWNPDVSCAWAR